MLRLLLCLLTACTVTACSVVAAGTGSPEPDFSRIQVGTLRSVVEQELGPPLSTEQVGSQERSLYSYKIGDKPAAGRALGYLALDIITLAFAEYILFPLEISNSGNAYQAAVLYSADGKVQKLEEKVDQ